MTNAQIPKVTIRCCCQPIAQSTGRLIVQLIVLLLLAGCATAVKSVPESSGEVRPLQGGSTVSRFEEGREGFVLTEKVSLDAGSRRVFNQAVDYLNNHDFDRAIALLEKVIESSPSVAAPYINLAIAYGKVGKPKPAEEHLKTALTLIPGHPVASNEYGLLLRKTGRFAEARKIYEEALTKFSEYLPVRKNLGILCDLYLNDYACALEQYSLYSEVDPGDEQVKLWISELRLRQGE